MIIDSGVPMWIISNTWLNKQFKETKVNDNEVTKRSCLRRFRLGKMLFVSRVEVTLPIVITMENNDYIKRKMTANIIDSDKITFLCKKTLTSQKTELSFHDNKLKFTEIGKSTQLNQSEGGHMTMNLENVGE